MRLVEGGRFAVRSSFPGTGDGLFAVRAFQEGAFVIEYVGKRVPTKTAEDEGSRYLFLLDEEWTIDGPVPDNVAGYINHACAPNCEARVEGGPGKEARIVIYTKRHIRSGEELTLDYGPEYFDKFITPVGCMCSVCINPRPPEPSLE